MIFPSLLGNIAKGLSTKQACKVGAVRVVFSIQVETIIIVFIAWL